jgi:hypothetical protein
MGCRSSFSFQTGKQFSASDSPGDMAHLPQELKKKADARCIQ